MWDAALGGAYKSWPCCTKCCSLPPSVLQSVPMVCVGVWVCFCGCIGKQMCMYYQYDGIAHVQGGESSQFVTVCSLFLSPFSMKSLKAIVVVWAMEEFYHIFFFFFISFFLCVCVLNEKKLSIYLSIYITVYRYFSLMCISKLSVGLDVH